LIHRKNLWSRAYASPVGPMKGLSLNGRISRRRARAELIHRTTFTSYAMYVIKIPRAYPGKGISNG